ncbi:N-acetyltransferase family 8 member 3 isoform X1 [Pygocentrus nattereri]|uniref:N-acetyltransferase domain-containing protein n=2 Tax=Pygocentrus nattereri TaxID=42514 RepID=A0AAR2LP87_PYGNA|nr:N-acetyltransferase family 8 member 3 isoform X1 [Pygocentrus nattereri]
MKYMISSCLVVIVKGNGSQLKKENSVVMWYQIREYCDSDYSAVREVYSTGFREHVGAIYVHILRQHWVQAVLLGLYLLFILFSASFLASLLYLGGVLLAGRLAVQYFFEQGLQLGLREDLQDIQASYMQPGQVSCFWVAESKGSVVGTVALLPCVEEPGAWELKRISVRKEFRGKGLAKALCWTALRFAASHKVRRVVLFTSLVQSVAHKLYHKMGFHKEEEFVWPSLPARLVNFLVFKYACKVMCDED